MAKTPLEEIRDAARLRTGVADDALCQKVQVLYHDGQAGFPQVRVGAGTFAEHLFEVVAPSVDLDELPSARAEDLYLACACLSGCKHAVEAFEQAHGAMWKLAVPSRLRQAGALPDDFEDALRMRVLVGDGERPALLSQFDGRGALGGWLRVTVTRAAIAAARRRDVQQRRSRALPDLLGLMAASPDPELDYLRHVYRQVFRAAFDRATGALTKRERTLLKMSAAQGVSVRKIATVYDVHHSTAARWVTSARDKLVAELRAQLAEQLGANTDELDSIVALIGDHVDLSISRCLGDA